MRQPENSRHTTTASTAADIIGQLQSTLNPLQATDMSASFLDSLNVTGNQPMTIHLNNTSLTEESAVHSATPKATNTTLEAASAIENTRTNGTSRKRVSHREIEKKRREGISNAINELTNCLPHYYLTSSRCQVISSAVEYIKLLENQVNELKKKQ